MIYREDQPLLEDMLHAFRADAFDYRNGAFRILRHHDIQQDTPKGPLGHRLAHEWAVKVPAPTRDRLLREGLIEFIPAGLGSPYPWRLSMDVLGSLAIPKDCPSLKDFKAACRDIRSMLRKMGGAE